MTLKRSTIGLLLILAACVPMDEGFPLYEAESGTTVSEVSPVRLPTVSTGTLMLGDKNAPVTMLLFTNYDCAYCKDFERNLMGRLKTDFIETGKLNVQIIPIPLQKYPDSDRNAHILLCGVRAGSGSDVHGRIFAGQTDFPALTPCLEDDAYLQQMMAQQYEAIRSLDVTLVPTYFINRERFTGLPEYADIRGQVEAAMK